MYAAVDIGGTKTLVAVFDETGRIIEHSKFLTAVKYDLFISELATTVDKFSTKAFQVVGAAAPGVMEHKEGIFIAGGNLKWKNVPLKADLEKIFKAPVQLENDAKAAALSEARLAGADFETVVYITIGTGIGVGICTDGTLDHTLLDAEPGRMSIDFKGNMVPWETIVSGKAIATKYGKQAGELEDIRSWQYISHNLAKGLLTIIAIVQPDLIVFGGGVGNYFDKFKTPLLKELKKYENPLAPTPPIKIAVHPEEAVIYGCYELAKDFIQAQHLS